MATSLDTLNNVGVKIRYRLVDDTAVAGPLDIFLTPDLADALGIPESLAYAVAKKNITQSVRSYLRKQYPGDTTTISVKAHDRLRSVGGVAFNNTLPGKSAYFGVVNDGPPRDQKEIQFQFAGRFALLIVAFPQNLSLGPAAGETYYLRTPYGVPKFLSSAPSGPAT